MKKVNMLPETRAKVRNYIEELQQIKTAMSAYYLYSLSRKHKVSTALSSYLTKMGVLKYVDPLRKAKHFDNSQGFTIEKMIDMYAILQRQSSLENQRRKREKSAELKFPNLSVKKDAMPVSSLPSIVSISTVVTQLDDMILIDEIRRRGYLVFSK